MNPTAILRHEHDAILKMLAAAERAAARLEAGDAVSPEILTGLVEFFKLFADKCHHGKEEDLLFPRLEELGMPREGGPIGCMLHEHVEGRALVRQMSDAAEHYGQGDKAAITAWADAAREYAGLLRAHIDKENNVLFVMADRMLSSADQEQLAAAFDRVEVEKMGAGIHERLHASMDRIWGSLFSPKD